MDSSVELIRRNPNFAWYWAGQGVSSLGSQVSVFALPLVTALTLDGSPGEVGVVAAASMLPYLLFSLLAGHWIEGRQGRATMVPCDLVQAVVIALVPVAAYGGWLSVPILVCLAFVSGTAAMIFGLSAFAYVPILVPRKDLPSANRAVQGTATLSEIIGPGLAGALVGWFGPASALAVDAVSYLASAVGVIKGRPAVRTRTVNARSSMLTGLRVLFTNHYLRALTVHAAMYNLAEELFSLNLVLWAVQHRGVSAESYGVALTAAGIGGLFGTLCALRLAGRLGLGSAFAVALLLSCFTPLAAGTVDLSGGALATFLAVVMLVAAVGLGGANVYSVTLRQAIIPADQLARSAGAYTQVMYGSIPVGSALAGLVGETFGTRVGVLLGAVGMAVSALPLLTRRFRSLRLPLGPGEARPADEIAG